MKWDSALCSPGNMVISFVYTSVKRTNPEAGTFSLHTGNQILENIFQGDFFALSDSALVTPISPSPNVRRLSTEDMRVFISLCR